MKSALLCPGYELYTKFRINNGLFVYERKNIYCFKQKSTKQRRSRVIPNNML